jgi:hypothetical protein
MVDRLPAVMFLMLPLFALLVQCCYLGSGHHYLQHLVFALHLHSAVFLLLAVTLVVGMVISVDWNGWVLLYAAIYLPLALVRAYGSGRAGAVGKSLSIAVVDGVLALEFLRCWLSAA